MTALVADASEAGPGDAPIELTRGEYVVSTDRARIDVGAVHAFRRDIYLGSPQS